MTNEYTSLWVIFEAQFFDCENRCLVFGIVKLRVYLNMEEAKILSHIDHPDTISKFIRMDRVTTTATKFAA